MKYTVYILTFFAYAMNYACRMTYAFNKPNIKIAFGLTPLHLGILDATIYISYGIGTIFRYYFFGERHLTRLYLISAIFISLFFASIPLVCIFAQQQLIQHVTHGRSIIWFDIGIVISMAGYGFSHLAAWQVILALMSHHWHSKKEGDHMGFWTTMSCMGNVIAFLVSNLIVNTYDIRWQVSMLLFAILNLFTALLLYYCVKIPNIGQSSQDSSGSSNDKQQMYEDQDYIVEEEDITTAQCIQYNKTKFLATWDFRLYLCTSTCLKICNYSFLFWYPMYLFVQGFQQVSGFVAMLFDITSIFGSLLIGKLMMYDKPTCAIFGTDHSDDNRFFKTITVLFKLRNVFIMIFSVAMVFLFLRHFGNIVANILITILLGLTIGGLFHVNNTFNAMNLAQHIPRNVDMISNFTTALGTTLLGFFQLVIGFALNSKFTPQQTSQQIREQKRQDYKKFFYILIVIMFLTALFMLIRSGVLAMLCESKDTKEKQKAKDKQQPKRQNYIKLDIKQIQETEKKPK